jgi:hypothetical protein
VATYPTSEQLLVIVDPIARRTDGEAVRIAKDVLSAGAPTKLCLPEDPEEFTRVLARRGSRRPVVIGDDRALVRAVSLLHRQRELAGSVLSVVPVGPAVSVARALGVPTGTVAAARTVLDGAVRRLDVLVDDSDGVVLGTVGIPPVRERLPEAVPEPEGARPWLRTCQTLVRTLVPLRPARTLTASAPSRLRVEVDGETVVDLDRPVDAVSLTPGSSGTALVEVRPASVGSDAAPVFREGRTVSVSGADFRYHADDRVSGPVRRRTWTVLESAFGLTLPAAGQVY